MSRLSNAVSGLLTGALLLAGVFLSPCSVYAQPPAPEPVSILTVDGVKLKAIFYPSTTKSAPTIIMLHPVGEGKSMKSPEWKSLAETLQKANFSVIMFDFRGHGESTSIDEVKSFWKYPQNVNNVRTKVKDTIEVKDFIKTGGAYLPVLCNDIAAVRGYLEFRNDNDKDCNASSLIVIGADNGATLGALWINSESYRYRFTPNPMAPLNLRAGMIAERAEGSDIIGGIFLTIQPKLESRTVKVEALLRSSCKERGMAAAFFCGNEDAKALAFAKSLEKGLKASKSKKHEYIGAVDLNTNLSGVKLLQKGLKTEDSIVDYLKLFVDERKQSRVDRDYANTYYVWQYGTQRLLSKTKKGDKTLNFDDYTKFIAQ